MYKLKSIIFGFMTAVVIAFMLFFVHTVGAELSRSVPREWRMTYNIVCIDKIQYITAGHGITARVYADGTVYECSEEDGQAVEILIKQPKGY